MDSVKHETENRKKLWKIQLDLLKKLKLVCAKQQLTCFATAGTLLGAVRHQGFIPWDDDIDVGLMWTDYQKLLQIAPNEFKYPYCFQSYLTDKEGEVNGSRLRRSDTTGFTVWEYENTGREYDRGIFIDIFPLFYVPDDPIIRALQKEKVLYFWQCIRGHDAYSALQSGRKVNEDYRKYIPVYESVREYMTIEELKTKYLEACAMVNIPQKEIGATASRVHLPKMMWNSEWFERFVELPFEDTTITCPIEYEKVLEKQYGDWRIPVIGGAMHTMVAVDTETPWKEFDMSSIS